MNRAERIVAILLETPEVAAFGGEFARMLLSPRRWPNFWALDAHGNYRFKERVADDDYLPLCEAIEQLTDYLRMNNLPMPVERWALKMPRHYCILGDGVVGKSFLGAKQGNPLGRVLVDNPLMTEQELRMWQVGL